jgi:hypothetical protein
LIIDKHLLIFDVYTRNINNMESKTPTRTEQILMVLKIVSWVALIGYLIEAGSMIFSYAQSTVNPEAAKNLYKGLNLYQLRQYNFWHYTLTVSFMVSISILKSSVWSLVVKTLSKIKLANPFTIDVAQKLEQISYVLFGTWLVGMLSHAHSRWLEKLTGEDFGGWVSGEFVFMAGLVFIISQIFKRGIEIQSENELTV